MGSRIGSIAAAIFALGAGVQACPAAETKTWYVYCEGAGSDGHWAVFSENLWPHAETADYGDRVASVAKAFFERRHDVSLEGCAGVNFRDDSLAEHSRQTTAQLHRRLGDRVYFFPLPNEVLRQELAPDPRVVLRAAVDGRDTAMADSSAEGSESTRWTPVTAPR
jgi:hypothetical protein